MTRPRDYTPQYIVYIITCRITGQQYVGCTQCPLHERWRQHQYNCEQGKDWPLYKAMRQFGYENFDKIIVYQNNNRGLAFDKEHRLVLSLNPAYNQTQGGLGSKGFRHTETAKEKLRVLKEGILLSENTRTKMSASHTGVPLPESTKSKIREKNGSPEMREHFRKTSTGRKFSEESLIKLRRTMSSPEHRELQRVLSTGRKHSEETKAKMRAAAARRQKDENGRYLRG